MINVIYYWAESYWPSKAHEEEAKTLKEKKHILLASTIY